MKQRTSDRNEPSEDPESCRQENAGQDGARPSNPLAARSTQRWLATAICVLLLFAVYEVFGQATGFPFVNHDDDLYVYSNPVVLDGLTLPGIAWAFRNNHVQVWIPATWLSLMLDATLYGGSPAGFHRTNVMLHGATVVALFLVLWQMTSRMGLSTVVAAMFAVHPLRAESVVWITERKDVLSGLFFVLAIAAYVGYVRRPPSVMRYLTMTALFVAGLMAKPMVVTLPCVLLLLDYWPLGRMSPSADDSSRKGVRPRRPSIPRRLLIEKVPLFAISVAFCLVTFGVQTNALDSNIQYPMSWRIANTMLSYGFYLEKTFWPFGLAVFYPRLGLQLPQGQVFFWFVALVGVTVGSVLYRRRFPYLLVGWLWFLGMLVPVIGLLQVGSSSVADRFSYLPQIGLLLALVWGVGDWCRASSSRRTAVGIAAGFLVFGVMLVCWRQVSLWRDNKVLWTHALQCTTGNFVANYALGQVLISEGQLEEGIALYQKAVALQPRLPVFRVSLGVALNSAKRFDEAIASYRIALQLDPNNPEIYYNLGASLASTGRTAEARKCFEKAIELNPNSTNARFNLAILLDQEGDAAGAVAQWRKVLHWLPNDFDCMERLAWTLATAPDDSVRNGAEAMKLAERAVELTRRQNPLTLGTLAAAYAEAGQFPKALETAQLAISLASKIGDKELVADLQTQAKCYQAGMPFRTVRSPSAQKD